MKCEHELGFVIRDDGRSMKCFACGRVRQVVSLPAAIHRAGFVLSREQINGCERSGRRYGYALTRWREPPVTACATPDGSIEWVIVQPKSIADALMWIQTILDDEESGTTR